ncbi:phage minor head protein [Rickettsiales bacterium]|nr:phage minor head protein [Rickettsiales bacterium]
MHNIFTQTKSPIVKQIEHLGVKNQMLITKSLDLGLFEEAKALQKIDEHLVWLLMQYKMFGGSTHYIWRTQDDKKVRPSHAANDDKIFEWSKKPKTGHPGEDFNCRCWAEPINAKEYANQLLITPINDQEKWGNLDFWNHYRNAGGAPVTLQETGYLAEIIDYYEYQAIASDGQPGVYRAINKQIIDKAKEKGEGHFDYPFGTTYNFYDVLYTFRNSTVKGVFEGDVRKEKDFLVINGIITYNFIDAFADIFTLVEIQVRLFGIDRGEAEERVRVIDDALGDVYTITDSWQTKFNATVKITN